jgi:poly-gamma-glutamate synthase PgsB/CapB
MLIHTDGSEELVDRAGTPSILEQKKLLFLARDEGADALVSEIMSILPENQAVESTKILALNVCVVTNVRIDHESEQGSSKSEVAAALSGSVPSGSPSGAILVCAAGADLPELRAEAERKGCSLRVAPPCLPEALRMKTPRLSYDEFDDNLATALETCLALGLDGDQALQSMADTVPDLGALRTWSWIDGASGTPLSFTNAFAANDIESSLAVLQKIASKPVTGSDYPLVGILNLRSDRGERTPLWRRAPPPGLPAGLAALHVTGLHAPLVQHRLRTAGIQCSALRGREPAALFSRLLEAHPAGFRAVGLGNIAGMGAALVDWCAGQGRLDAR